MDQMTLDIPKKFEEILDKRGTGSSEFHTQTIVDLLREQNKSLLERLDSLTLSPAAADDDVVPMHIADEDADGDLASSSAGPLTQKRTLKVGCHSGKLQVLPVGWQFPKGLNVVSLIHNWYVGDTKNNVPPLKLLTPQFVGHIQTAKNPQSGKSTLRMMRSVMDVLEVCAAKEGFDTGKGHWSAAFARDLWEKVGKKYFSQYCMKGRAGGTAWTTLYSNLSFARAFDNGDITPPGDGDGNAGGPQGYLGKRRVELEGECGRRGLSKKGRTKHCLAKRLSQHDTTNANE